MCQTTEQKLEQERHEKEKKDKKTKRHKELIRELLVAHTAYFTEKDKEKRMKKDSPAEEKAC